jgi:hypothetical protein
MGVRDDGDVEADDREGEGEQEEADRGEQLEEQVVAGRGRWRSGRRGFQLRQGVGVDLEGLLLEDDVGGGRLCVRGGVAAAGRHGWWWRQAIPLGEFGLFLERRGSREVQGDLV